MAKNGFCAPLPPTDGKKDLIYEVVTAYEKILTKTSEEGDSWMSQVQSWVEDIFKSWHILAISSVTALVLGYLYLFVIRIIGGLIIWLSIILIEIFLFAASMYTFYRRSYEIEAGTQLYNYMTWAGYGILALAVIVLIIMCCCWHAIKIGIAVFKTTSQYV